MMLHVSARAVTWRGTLGMMLHVSARADLERYSWHDADLERDSCLQSVLSL